MSLAVWNHDMCVYLQVVRCSWQLIHIYIPCSQGWILARHALAQSMLFTIMLQHWGCVVTGFNSVEHLSERSAGLTGMLPTHLV